MTHEFRAPMLNDVISLFLASVNLVKSRLYLKNPEVLVGRIFH